MSDLQQLLRRLAESGIEFVLVGDYPRVLSAAIEVELFGRRIRAISLDDLIAAKEALGRDKDLLVAKELRAIRDRQ